MGDVTVVSYLFPKRKKRKSIRRAGEADIYPAMLEK